MDISFYIAESRLGELRSFIRTFTPSVRFNHSPLKEGNMWFISLNMKVEDCNKLNKLLNKWYDDDRPQKIPNKCIWKQFLNLFSK